MYALDLNNVYPYTYRNSALNGLWKVNALLGFPGGSDSKESACNERDMDSIIPGLGRSPGEENGRCFITQ